MCQDNRETMHFDSSPNLYGIYPSLSVVGTHTKQHSPEHTETSCLTFPLPCSSSDESLLPANTLSHELLTLPIRPQLFPNSGCNMQRGLSW